MDDKIKDSFLYDGCGTQMMLYVFIGILMFCLSSCKTIQYVPVPEYHHDSIFITKYQHDSIYQHDSVYVKEYAKGDTVFVEKTKWHTKYVEQLVRDTTFIEKTDSVSVPYPVEKKLTRWQQIKIDWGGEAIVVLFVLLIITIWLIVARLRR